MAVSIEELIEMKEAVAAAKKWHQGRLIRLSLNNKQNFTVMQDKTI